MDEKTTSTPGQDPTPDATARAAELERRVAWLEERIASLESRAYQAPPVPGPTRWQPPQAGPLDDLLVRKRHAGRDAAPPQVGVASPPARAPIAPAALPQSAQSFEWTPSFVAPPSPVGPIPPARPAALGYRPLPAPPAPLAEGALEQTIGLKWAGWVGALVVVIGAALGVKYAYDAGWFALAPPELRMALMAFVGFGFIAAGEVVYRKVNRISAAGLFAAGVATLFLVSYTGYGFLDVYNQQVAFILMAATTIVGAAVAVRGKLISIAVLSLLGGNLTPIILGGDVKTPLPLLSYLLMLQAVALVLAWWGGTTRWWALRWLSLVTTSLWMASPSLLFSDFAGDMLLFAFVLIYAGLFLSELMISAARPREVPDLVDQGAGVAFSLALTLALVLGMMIAQQDAGKLVRGAWLVGFAAVYAMAGLALAGAGAGRMLAITLRTLAAALVVIAVPVALSGSAVVLVWTGMAVAFGAVGARLNLLISRAASGATWLAAVVYLVGAVSSPDLAPDPEDVAMTLAGTDVPVYVLLAWLLSLAGLTVAWLLTQSGAAAALPADEARATPPVAAEAVSAPGWSLAAAPADLLQAARLLAALATAVWVIGSLHGLPTSAATVALLIYAWMATAIDLGAPQLALAAHAMAVLAFAAVKWSLADLLAQRLGPQGWTTRQLQHPPILNPIMALGGLISSSIAAVYWLRRKAIEQALDRMGAHPESRSVALAVAAGLIALVTLGLTMEIDRIIERGRLGAWTLALGPNQVRLLAFTALWCASASALAGLAIRLEPDPARRRTRLAPLGILPILLAAKFLLVDTTLFHLAERRVRGMVLLNLECFTAVLVLGTIALHAWPLRSGDRADAPSILPAPRRSSMASTLGATGLLVALLLGQWEIGRAMNVLNVTPLARGVSVSVWWSLFAVAAVAAGFITRKAGLRYFGLALFALTLLKVFVIDLQTLDRGWRTISFIALGLLLLGTSVIYGKYSPKLLGRGSSE